MLDSILADEVSKRGWDYFRAVIPYWVGLVVPLLVSPILLGANPYSATTVYLGVAILLWGAFAFGIVVPWRNWRNATSPWLVR